MIRFRDDKEVEILDGLYCCFKAGYSSPQVAIILGRAIAAEIKRIALLKTLDMGVFQITSYQLLMPGPTAAHYWNRFVELRIKFILQEWK